MSETTIVDGNAIQKDIKQRLTSAIQERGMTPRLDLVYAGDDAVIETFMRLKKQFGESIGARVVMHTFAEGTKQSAVADTLQVLAASDAVNGMLVQLPLPDNFQTQQLLDQIPKQKDVDVLSSASRDCFANEELTILPPVVGAVAEVFERYEIDITDKRVGVVGHGSLVGEPLAVWLQHQGVTPMIFERGDELGGLQQMDIIISGVGEPHMITPKMVQPGVVLIDAGTSQTDGGSKGDIDPSCKDKSSLFSPVPGGIGPITVAKVFENLLGYAN